MLDRPELHKHLWSMLGCDDPGHSGVIPAEIRNNAVQHLLRQPEENLDKIRDLLDASTSPGHLEKYGDTALHVLASIPGPNSAKVMSALLTVGLAEPESNQSKYRRMIETPNSHGYTPLVVAVMYGQVHCVKVLVSAGADPNNPGETGNSAFRIAVERSNYGVQQALSGSLD
jgi:ankyrin repeat protein